jgi:hypothetical protein
MRANQTLQYPMRIHLKLISGFIFEHAAAHILVLKRGHAMYSSALRTVAIVSAIILLPTSGCIFSDAPERIGMTSESDAGDDAADAVVDAGPDASLTQKEKVLEQLPGDWSLIYGGEANARAGVVIFLEFELGSSTPRPADLGIYDDDSSWSVAADGRVITLEVDWSEVSPFTDEMVEIVPAFSSDDELVTLTASIDNPISDALPPTQLTFRRKSPATGATVDDLVGEWKTDESQPPQVGLLVLGDDGTYLGYENSVSVGIIGGDVELFSSGNQDYWALVDAEYLIDEPACVGDCFRRGDPAVNLGGVIHVADDMIYVPIFRNFGSIESRAATRDSAGE